MQSFYIVDQESCLFHRDVSTGDDYLRVLHHAIREAMPSDIDALRILASSGMLAPLIFLRLTREGCYYEGAFASRHLKIPGGETILQEMRKRFPILAARKGEALKL